MKQGHITANGVVLQQHEISTIVFLTQQGFDVSLIPPQRRKGAHTPDIYAGTRLGDEAPQGPECAYDQAGIQERLQAVFEHYL